MASDYLTGEQAAAFLGIARRTLYRWMEIGKLRSEEWTRERLEARREELLHPQRTRPAPHCGTCGASDPAHFTACPNRPSGYAGNCKACNAARMKRARMRSTG